MQKSVTQFVSPCGRAKMYIENDMPIGVFHDYLMEIKGMMVERMVVAHKEQLAETEAAKELPPHESEISASEGCGSENCTESAKGE